MQVYAVIGGYDYDGEDFASLKLFDCESAARVYEEYLKVMDGYDYVKFRLQEVEMHSAFAA